MSHTIEVLNKRIEEKVGEMLKPFFNAKNEMEFLVTFVSFWRAARNSESWRKQFHEAWFPNIVVIGNLYGHDEANLRSLIDLMEENIDRLSSEIVKEFVKVKQAS